MVLLGAGLVLLAQGRPWVTGRLTSGLSTEQLSVTGAQAAPGTAAMALVAAACAVVLATGGRFGRWIATGSVLLVGLGILAVTLGVPRAPASALRAAVATATGTTTSAPGGSGSGLRAAATLWPWVTVLGAVLILIGGVVAVLRLRTWAGPSPRYEPVATVAANPGLTPWEALNRGEDPTQP